MAKVWCQQRDPAFLHALGSAGVLAQFSGLLSCHGDELAMLEDWVVALEDLGGVTFCLEPATNVCSPKPRVEGNRWAPLAAFRVFGVEEVIAPPPKPRCRKRFSDRCIFHILKSGSSVSPLLGRLKRHFRCWPGPWQCCGGSDGFSRRPS